MPTGEGALLVIGGAEDKLGRRAVLGEFVARAGGAQARIAVVPTASSLGPEIIDVYSAVFTRLGAAEVYGVRPERRPEASDPGLIEQLERAIRETSEQGPWCELVGRLRGSVLLLGPLLARTGRRRRRPVRYRSC